MRKLFTKALSGAMALVLAVGLCPAAALASPVTSAELPAAQSVTTQADPAPTGSYGLSNVELKDGTYTLYGMYSTFSMAGVKLDSSDYKKAEPIAVVDGDKVKVTVTFGDAKYTKIALTTKDKITPTSGKYGTLDSTITPVNGSPIMDGACLKFTFDLTQAQLRDAIVNGLDYVVYWSGKNKEHSGEDWYVPSAQPKFMFDALDFAPVEVAPYNDAYMLTIVKAAVSRECLSSYNVAQYYLNLYTTSSSYSAMFGGDLRAYNANTSDAVIRSNLSSADVALSYYKYVRSGTTGGASSTPTIENKQVYCYKIPVNSPDKIEDAYETSLATDFVAVGTTSGNVTGRHASIDLEAGSVHVSNASGSIDDLAVNSSVDDVKASPVGKLSVDGYALGAESGGCYTSLDYMAALEVKLADGAATYDKATIDTYSWDSAIGDKGAYSATATPSDEIAVAADGTLKLPLSNVYKNTAQIKDGKTAKINLHVSNSANYQEAGKWVSRDISLDTFLTDADAKDETAKSVTISGAALTPKTSLQGATVQVNESGLAYDGSAKTPAVTVKIGSTTLRAGTDYTTSYANNVNAGTATVTVTAKSGSTYTGSASAKFTIAKGKQTVTAAKSAYKVSAKKVKKAKKKIAVKFTSTSGGKVTWGKAKTAKGKVSIAKNGKVTVKKGTKKGTYKLKVKVVAVGSDNYEQATVKNVLVVVRVK